MQIAARSAERTSIAATPPIAGLQMARGKTQHRQVGGRVYRWKGKSFLNLNCRLSTVDCRLHFTCEELRVICGTRGVPGTVAPFRAWRGSRDLVAQSPKLHAPAVAHSMTAKIQFNTPLAFTNSRGGTLCGARAQSCNEAQNILFPRGKILLQYLPDGAPPHPPDDCRSSRRVRAPASHDEASLRASTLRNSPVTTGHARKSGLEEK